MPFVPVKLPPSGLASRVLRWRTTVNKNSPRLRISVPPVLYRACKCGTRPVKAWLLEFDKEADKGRLTCLDETPIGSRKHNPRVDNDSIILDWTHAGEVAELFPASDSVQVFTGVEVTPNGIVFDLPKQPQRNRKS